MKEPTKIVITPVRNEAWVLDAFLTCTSSWADYIILADQHSDDGTREIAAKYEKVILIDNPTQEWYEYLCRTRLLEEAAKIPGDKIIFGLDADEFLSEGFEKTESWQRIISSDKNEIFCFNWLNLFDNFTTAEYTSMHFEWAAHFDASLDFVEEYKKREKHAVHCSRVPCLETERCTYTNVDDFWVVHLAKLNHQKMQQKFDFYQVTWVDKNKEKANPINMYRGYSKYYPDNISRLDNPVKLCCKGDAKDYSYLIKSSDYGKHYVDEMVQVFQREGTNKFLKLCIWDNPYLKEAGINPKIPLKYKLLHSYLKKTQQKSDNKLIKLLDKILKRII
ncbi:MAG: glycosyltransferase family 2 protein [Bacteroidales bacterium]|nr:glycosyltransferase family 2 protein [Bacteroidales bacterium]